MRVVLSIPPPPRLQPGAKVATGEEDAAKVLADLTKGSAAEDENPVSLAITALLGIGSLVAGGLMHTHHETFMKPTHRAQLPLHV